MPSLVLFALVLVAFFLLVVRPQRARARATALMQARLAPGAEIMTTSGLHGTVRELLDDAVLLEIAPGVTVRFAKAAVGRIIDVTASDTAAVDDDSEHEHEDSTDSDAEHLGTDTEHLGGDAERPSADADAPAGTNHPNHPTN